MNVQNYRHMKQKEDRTTVILFLFRRVRTREHAKQRKFSSVVLKMNNDQEESVSSAVYKFDTSTNAAFFENFPNYCEGYQYS